MNTKRISLLIVEDEKMLAEMYATKFKMEGYNTHTAYDGADGLEKARKLKPNIILLDIIMPKLDGFAVLKELRNDPAFKKIPIILLTNLGQEDDIKKGKELGANDYFVKANHTPTDIVQKVGGILGKRK